VSAHRYWVGNPKLLTPVAPTSGRAWWRQLVARFLEGFSSGGSDAASLTVGAGKFARRPVAGTDRAFTVVTKYATVARLAWPRLVPRTFPPLGPAGPGSRPPFPHRVADRGQRSQQPTERQRGRGRPRRGPYPLGRGRRRRRPSRRQVSATPITPVAGSRRGRGLPFGSWRPCGEGVGAARPPLAGARGAGGVAEKRGASGPSRRMRQAGRPDRRSFRDRAVCG
jgi:hypothetical protein